MTQRAAKMLSDVAEYYTARLAEHGPSPLGVDWNGEESQNIRFEQLAKLIPPQGPFSINDLGCGYGAFADYLKVRYPEFTYYGYDVSNQMLDAARARYGRLPAIHFHNAPEPNETADYGVASGIFNVRLKAGDAEWRAYIEATLDALNRTSRKGFAFNCLTSYSDKEKMKNYLHYADPCSLFDLCKRRYARQVALLHDYGLYDFTIIVRK